jgi:UTP:GlnB (protein PII) uridylyltransferase
VTPTTSSDAVGITLGSCRPTCTPQNLFIADIPQIRVQSQDSNRFQINVLTCSRPGIAFDLVCAFRALNVVIQRASVTVTDCVDSQDALPLTDAAPVEPRVCAQFLIQMPGAPDPQTPSERNLAAIGSNTALIETQLCSMLLDALCNPVCMHNRDDSAMTCVELHSYARDGQLVDLLRFMHAARLRVRRARVRTHGVRVRNLLYLTDMVMQKAVPSILWADLRAQILATTLGVDCLALIYPASADQRTAELSGVA